MTVASWRNAKRTLWHNAKLLYFRECYRSLTPEADRFYMETNAYLTFLGLAVAVIVIPGPSILLIVSNSLQLGRASGLYTVAGTSAAMLLQLGVAVLVLTSLFSFRAEDLNVIRWLGIAYLCYLGIKRWRSPAVDDHPEKASKRQYQSAFAAGFFVSLVNPTTMAFFVAFFPQFLVPDGSLWQQLLFMSVAFWLLALPFDIAYALLAGRMSKALRSPTGIVIRNRCSGAVIVAAAVWMASTKL